MRRQVISIAFSKRFFVDLTCCRERDNVKEDIIGQPPAHNSRFETGANLFCRDRFAVMRLDYQKWALFPFRMVNADHRSDPYTRASGCGIF